MGCLLGGVLTTELDYALDIEMMGLNKWELRRMKESVMIVSSWVHLALHLHGDADWCSERRV